LRVPRAEALHIGIHATERGPRAMHFIVPNGDASLYSYIKHVTLVQNSVVSQCVDTKSFKNPKMMKPIAGNVFKQMMAKLGHMLWRIDFSKQVKNPALSGVTMFVGMDVSHDKKLKGSFGKMIPGSNSTVGFCATWNRHFSAYHSYMGYQNKGEEYVTMAQQMMKASLEAFKEKK